MKARKCRNVIVNAIAIMPQPIPSAAVQARSIGAKLMLPTNPNSGSGPINAAKVLYETTDAISDGSNASWARSSLYGISSANTIPVKGALNTAAIPAAAPHINISRRSPGSSPNRRSLTHNQDPMAPPPYMLGPSSAALPPQPTVVTAASNFQKNGPVSMSP